MTTDLSSRLLAAIEETERIARAAAPGPWRFEGDDPTDDEVYSIHDGEHGDLVGDPVAYARGKWQQPNTVHIAHQNPHATLIRCAAVRKIVAEHEQVEASGVCNHPTGCRTCHNDPDCGITHGHGDCDTMIWLAEVCGITVEAPDVP